MSEVRDNAERRRFELDEAGQTAFADYQRRDGILVVSHVESPLALRGKGAAGRLMAGVCALARARGEKIVPRCAYADAWMRRHPETADLRA